MKNPMAHLLALQNLELRNGQRPPEADQEIEALRKKIPESLLTKFDRWLARGRKAVAVVRNGVCSECHIRLAVGVVGALTVGDEIQQCGNCGRFLYLPEIERGRSGKSVEKAKPARHHREAPANVH